MYVSVKEPVTRHVVAIRVSVPVDEEDAAELPRLPGLLNGKRLTFDIDLDERLIRGWPVGTAANISIKVCDGGLYDLLDPRGYAVASLRHEYVPDFFPGMHYGDYLLLQVDGDGVITDWPEVAPKDLVAAFWPDE